MRVISDGALLPTPFVSVPVNASGERGLLGIAFDPAFLTNQFVSVYYTTSTPPVHNRISRFTADGADGKLYAGVGGNATPPNAQSLTNVPGKITGAAVYNPPVPQFPTEYAGLYFFGDFCNGWINTYNPANDEVASFASGVSSLVDLQVGPVTTPIALTGRRLKLTIVSSLGVALNLQVGTHTFLRATTFVGSP